MAPRKKAIPVPEHIAMAAETPAQTALERQTNATGGEQLENTNKSGETTDTPIGEAEKIGLIALRNFDTFSDKKLKDCFANIAARLASIDGRDGEQESALNLAAHIAQI